MASRATTPCVLALVGPTASGKSAVAFDVAQHIDAEIVAVDAFTVYRGMDIGTAKPPPGERMRIPHHMIDVLEPTESCSVQWFQRTARACVDDVLARGRTPLLVGGSGLYFRAVVDNLEFPPTDARVRQQVAARVGDDAGRAHAELALKDPAAAARIDPGNLRRCVRALEVLELTGRPFSAWRTTWSDYRSRYADLRVVGVDVARGEVDRRIAARTRRMLDEGLIDEAGNLLRLPLSGTARAAIGYAETFAYLERGAFATIELLAEAIRVRTRQFAVRQQRWFGADPRIRWVAAEAAARELMIAWNS